MYKDNLIIFFLIGFIGIIFIASLPAGELVKLQPTIAAVFAFLAALITYFSAVNSVHEKHRLEQEASKKQRAQEEAKQLIFMIEGANELILKTRGLSLHVQENKTNPSKAPNSINIVKKEFIFPAALSLNYKEYFFLNEQSVKILSLINLEKHMIDGFLDELSLKENISHEDHINYIANYIINRLASIASHLELLIVSLTKEKNLKI